MDDEDDLEEDFDAEAELDSMYPEGFDEDIDVVDYDDDDDDEINGPEDEDDEFSVDEDHDWDSDDPE